MKFIDFLKKFWAEKNTLDRMIWGTLLALLVVVSSFSGYYYWDRYVHLGDQSPIELSVKELEGAVRNDPTDIDARLNLAQQYYDFGSYQSAINQCEQILELYPDTDGAMFITGMSYYRLQDLDLAVEYLSQFSKIRKESSTAYTDIALETSLYFLGETLNKLDRPEEAIPELLFALEIDFTDADAMYQLGLAYARTDQPQLAVEQFHQAVRFVPDFIEAYQGMINSYSDMNNAGMVAYSRGMEAYVFGEFEVSITHLVAAIEDYPEFAPAYVGLGLSYEKLDDLEKAEIYILKALEIDPDNFLAQNTLGRIRSLMDNQDS